ncbi:MAG: bifunctional phosphoribosylaminoimidazolecarboxamide formyltransferase/IMP cyclohydrolase [Elusimicrobia bacterium]|nr:bifunctional phosphoribosylaminoimidazolecarboxamide formyltransferase/IMP cyclohydrolase [Elusimicrobiota bacterium]
MSAKPKEERWALLHVTDKTGVTEFAYALHELGWHVVATGGTAAALRQAEAAFTPLEEFVGDPRLLESALGLLHPKVLAGIAADRGAAGAMHELERRGARPIDLVAANLYPLSEAAGDGSLSQAEVLSYVDLAGPALLRAAARNFSHVVPLCDPDDYQQVVESLRAYGRVLAERRQALAAKAFHAAAYYDSTVAQYLGGKWDKLPDEIVVALKKSQELPYGDNPHQAGAFYSLSGARPWGLNAAKRVYGRFLAYGHYLDLETAWELVSGFREPACAIVKHGVPAGFAAAEDLAAAARGAYAGDPRGCFRGTAAVNREVDAEAAGFFAEEYVSCIAAPDFSPKALALLKTKKDIRLVTLPSFLISAHELDLRAVAGGVLVQEKDQRPFAGEPKQASKRAPTQRELAALTAAWRVAMHARTHAAVIARGTRTLGIGSGQTSRLDAVRLALSKSQERHPIVGAGEPIVLASDGALTAEHVHAAADGGVTALIHPGGASDDRDAAQACDHRRLALLTAGLRHFRH